MKAAILCFSLTGYQTGRCLKKGLASLGWEVTLDGKSKYLPDSIEISHQKWTAGQFQNADALVFVGACGIAVRSIAPFVKSKKTDPGVLVIDECGKFVISLLSGHLGGANDFAGICAEILDALPVVTTATDLHGCFAVDMFAKKNSCGIFHMKEAKEVSAALLAGENVGFYSDYPYGGSLPKGLVLCDREGYAVTEEGTAYQEGFGNRKRMDLGIAVTIYEDVLPFPSTVHVVPKTAVLGIGCRKGREEEAICEVSKNCIKAAGIYPESISCIASIDLKREEPGILSLCENWKLPFTTFTGEELLEAEGEFSPSDFVRQVTGVDNVCERSAVLAAGQGKLIQKKVKDCGVTTAMAVREWRICFE